MLLKSTANSLIHPPSVQLYQRSRNYGGSPVLRDHIAYRPFLTDRFNDYQGMNVARCRGLAAFTTSHSVIRVPGWVPVRAITSSNISLKTKKKTESIDFDALPKSKLDPVGQPVKPLDDWREYKKDHQAPSADVAEDEERLYKDAVAAGDVPDTALSKQVYLNWKRFPDCIVLTRVGKFYEASPTCCPQ